MPRHNRKERIGIKDFSSFVTKHSDWIVQGEPEVDVGIDLIIEKSINDDPDGTLIACQVKSGNSYFRITKDGRLVFDSITYVHREYWTKYDIPVILILVDDNGIIYWQLLNHKTIKKAKLKFKIEIPKNQKLLPENINDVFERVSHSKNPRNLVVDEIEAEDNDSIHDNISSIQLAYDAGINITKAFEKYSERTRNITERLDYYREKGVRENRKKINNQMNKMATQTNILGNRIESEIEGMAKGLSISLLSIRKLFLNIGINNIPNSDLRLLQSTFLKLYEGITYMSGTLNLFDDVISKPSNYKELKKSDAYLSNVMILLDEELKNIKRITEMILEVLNNNLQEVESHTTQ